MSLGATFEDSHAYLDLVVGLCRAQLRSDQLDFVAVPLQRFLEAFVFSLGPLIVKLVFEYLGHLGLVATVVDLLQDAEHDPTNFLDRAPDALGYELLVIAELSGSVVELLEVLCRPFYLLLDDMLQVCSFLVGAVLERVEEQLGVLRNVLNALV